MSTCTPKRIKFALTLGVLKLVVFYFLFVYSPNHQPTGSTSVSQKHHQIDTVLHAKQSTAMERPPDLSLSPSILPSEKEPFAVIHLDGYDSLKWKLFPSDAPKTVANFVKLSRNHVYDGATLYRYEANFCLQGGGWPKKGSPYGTIPLEYKLPNKKFAISMARTAERDSATMEFSIMLNDNSKWLGPGGSDPHGYAVFAEVVEGFGVIEALGKRATKKQGLTVFVEPVTIKSVDIVNYP